MHIRKSALTILVTIILLLVFTLPALSVSSFADVREATAGAGPTVLPARTLSFQGCSNNDPFDTFIGEDQFTVDIYPWQGNDGSATQALFVFRNTGPEQVSLTDVYFDDGVLLGISSLYDADQPTPPGDVGHPGVDFSLEASPPNLPSPNCVVPPFGTLQLFSADSDSNPGSTQQNGVQNASDVPPNPQVDPEVLGVVFDLLYDPNDPNAMPFQALLDNLTSGVVRIGVRGTGYASGGSESFVSANATAITLDSFSGHTNNGTVTLAWTTGTEIDNAGFYLYRSRGLGWTEVQLNSALITAQGDPTSGASYELVDRPGYGVYYYWLEDVDYYGVRTRHGPFQVNVRPSFRRPDFRPSFRGQ